MKISAYVDDILTSFESGGAFLTSKDAQGKVNVMTIGWGTVGTVWGRPFFLVLVRKSRHTFDCMNVGENFTVSVPKGTMKKELAFCGSRSGRDHDKIRGCGMTLIKGKRVDVPVISGCHRYVECAIRAKKQLERGDILSPDILSAFYPRDDHHMVFFGEILAIYSEEDTER